MSEAGAQSFETAHDPVRGDRAINAWNRLCIAARLVPGAYKPTVAASPVAT